MSQRIVVIASAEGGVDIEEVAAVEPRGDPQGVRGPGRRICWTSSAARSRRRSDSRSRAALVHAAAEARSTACFRDKDCLLLEINPFIETEDGDLIALDAKMTFDDNSLFRRGDVAELRDFDEEDPKEVDAAGHGLNYIALDGTVGCIVNGAGLAMATMDAIVHHGGRPANFLDVGGGASPEKIANAFRIVLQDPNVRSDPREHLRRHQPVRLDRAGRRAGGAGPGDRRAGRSCGWPARTWRRAARSWTRAGWP